MTTRRILLAWLLLLPVSSGSSYAECINSKVAFFFVNGIWKTPDAATTSAVELEGRLNDELVSFDDVVDNLTCYTNVELAYNATQGAADLYQSAKQRGYVSGNEAGAWNGFLKVLSNILLIGGDPLGAFLAESASKTITALHFDNVNSQEASDLKTQLGQYRLALDAGKRVVVFAHSQGNMFANEAYRKLVDEYGPLAQRFTIIAVATPDTKVEPYNAAPWPHTTIFDDFIWKVPGALPENVPLIEADAPCGSPWDCHSFTGTYLKAVLARKRIWQKTRQALAPRVESDAFSVNNGQLLRVSERELTANDELIGLDAPSRIEFLDPLPDGFTQVGNGFAYVPPPNTRGTVTTAYSIHSSLGTSDFASVTIDVGATPPPPPPLNQPPTARFSMSGGSQVVMSPGSLNVAADPATGEARVMFVDTSLDPDGDPIVSRVWTVDTQTDPLSIGDSTFTWGFTPGQYTVRLTIEDDHHNSAHVVALVVVAPYDVAAHTTFDIVTGFSGSPVVVANPAEGLIQGRDGDFYGVTPFRQVFGTGQQSVIFKVSAGGDVVPLFVSGLTYPHGPLVEGSDGNFYGTTEAGGINDLGTIFSITPAGRYTTLHQFGASYDPSIGTYRDGYFPKTGLLLASDGNLYGTTFQGGSRYGGTVFRISSAGLFSVIANLSESDSGGSNPTAGLVEGADLRLYGTTDRSIWLCCLATAAQRWFRVWRQGPHCRR